MLIGYLLLGIILFMIYIYGGLRLVEPIKNDNMYIFFWIAYVIFGITLFNIIIISNFWGKLSTKVGPPGPRGPRGNDGSLGPNGECSNDHNIIYAQKLIKETIADTILTTYNDLKKSDIINEKTLRLKNNYLDYKINLIIQSNQFTTVLKTPSDDNTTKDKVKVFGKSIEELSSYLANTWVIWINLIIGADKENAKKLFTTLDAQIDISDDIETIFNTEIMKYDVWYWGSTRVFRPLQAELCRKEITDSTGKLYQNTRYPINNRPLVEVREITFTDKTIESSDNFIKILDMNLNRTTDNMSKADENFKNKYDLASRYSSAVFYLPKVYTVPSTGQKFYPIGCVIVDKNKVSEAPRKTILVSGDIVFPTRYELIWDNELEINDIYKCFYGYSRKRGARKTERKRNTVNLNTKYNAYLDNTLINKANNYTLLNNTFRHEPLTTYPDSIINKVGFYKFDTNVPGYQMLGDLPSNVAFNKSVRGSETIDILDIINYNSKDTYTGIVGLPTSVLNKLKTHDVVWSFRYNNLLDTNLSHKGRINIPKPRGESKYNKNYYYDNKTLTRKVINAKQADVIKNNNYDIVNLINNKEQKKLYEIKNEVINPEKYPIKDLDPQYLDLGFGWFGYPIKKYRKYSIFAYLGLMPEGIIINRKTGRKFYFRHYGGVEPNRFIVYLWNSKEKDYTNALKVANENSVIISRVKATDPRYQFKVDIVENNPSYFRLVPYEFPNSYITINADVNENANLHTNASNIKDQSLKDMRPKGINLDHTRLYINLTRTKGAILPNNPTLFYNQPAYGTNVNIVDEQITRNIDRSKSPQEQYNQTKKLDQNRNFKYLEKDILAHDMLTEPHPESNIIYS